VDVLGPVLCADEYTEALTLGPNFACDHASISVGANAGDTAGVLYQLAQGVPGDWRWTDEREFTAIPQAFGIGRIVGIRFRNKVAGKAATVQVFLMGRHDPDIAPARAFGGSAGGLQFGGNRRDYGPDNEGGWLYVKANEHTDSIGIEGEFGIQLHDQTGEGAYILSGTPAGAGFGTLVVTNSEAGFGWGDATGRFAYVVGGPVGPASDLDIAVKGGAGTVMRFIIGVHIPITLLETGHILTALPTVAGPSGTLYNALGFVKVAP